MRNNKTGFIFILLFAALTIGCGGSSASGGNSLSSSGQETVSSSKEDVKESVTADRSIIAESLTGKVEAHTEAESYELVAGEKLESGRYIRSYDNSDLTMLLDADKHVYAGNETKLHLTAEGKKGSSKTRIDLYDGTLVIGIDEKLNAEETFEINTPNATMAVRGTVFTVTVERQKDLSFATNLKVDQGAVEAVTTENGEKKTETIEAGGSRVFTGENVTPPEVPAELVLQGFADRSFLSEEGLLKYDEKMAELYGDLPKVKSVDEIPASRDGSKGFSGVYRCDGFTVVIAENVKYAFNRIDGIIVDENDTRPFAVATVAGGDPFFARSASKVSSTLITDYTFREDENVHVADMEYYLDGDILYYHRRINEDDFYEEFKTLKRTEEDPVAVYNSFLSGSGTSGASSGSDEEWADYYRNPKEGYFFAGGTVYQLIDHYRDAVEEKGKETNGEVVGAGMVVFFDVPQEYNGEMIDHCCFLFCDREMPAKEEWDGVHMEFYGFWGEDYESPEPELDITEQVLGNLHTFYAYRHRKD